MQLYSKDSRIGRHMSKTNKIITTLFIILLIFIPIGILLIYPHYNNILLWKNSFRIQSLAKESITKTLVSISPKQENYQKEVLGTTSIEESLKEKNIILTRKVLEEMDTYLQIEKLNIEGRILQGEDSKTMDQGFWHFPLSVFPGEKGNSVIIGHRFMNLPPNPDTFFNLDKVSIGDKIRIVQSEGDFTYIVVNTKIVSPEDISVIQDTNDYTLTLITCTPLWTSEKRLVVVAKLDKLYKKV